MTTKMSTPKPAGTAEILRASQTDELHLRYMRNLVSDIIQRCFGIPTWLQWKDLCSTLSDTLFFSLTSLSGLQTLGEEYANIIQVDRSFKAVPSKWARATDIGLRTVGFYVLSRAQGALESQLSSSLLPPGGEDVISQLHARLPLLFRALAVLLRLHLVAFYFHGSYHSMAKRLTGIRYVVIRRWLSSEQAPYRTLGWIAAVQLALSLIVSSHAAVTSTNPTTALHREEEAGEEVNVRNQCSLCFERRERSTATPCGHLFCWTCITQWMQNKEECPLCRESFPPAKLVPLQNYY